MGEKGLTSREKAAWYTLAPGRWADWVSLLHPPYTAWHLGYVLVGAGLAPHLSVGRLIATLVAFGLAVGVGAHALDELRGRPLGTSVPAPALVTVSSAAIGSAVVIGCFGIARVGWGLAAFIVVGVLLAVGYNLELWGLHNDIVFALAGGSFPLLTAYFAQVGTLRPAAIAGAAFAFGLSRAQRALSNEARDMRRRVAEVSGEKIYRDGSRRVLSRESLLRPLEVSLVALSWSTCALGVGMVLSRAGY
jgi:hypothetical protein